MKKDKSVNLPQPIKAYFLIKNPIGKPPVSALKLSEKEQAEINKRWADEQLIKVQKVEVLATGKDCSDIKVGDLVKIKSARFMYGEPIDENYLIYHEADVLAIY